jgi:hypothetical protein
MQRCPIGNRKISKRTAAASPEHHSYDRGLYESADAAGGLLLFLFAFVFRHLETPPDRALERRNDVEDLLAVGGLLDLHDASAAAVGDARFRDLLVGDRIIGRDIARPDDTLHIQDA